MAVLMNLSSRAFPVIMGPAVPRVSLGFFRPLCCRASGDEALLFVAASCVLFVAVCFVHVFCSLRCVCCVFVRVFCSLRFLFCFGRCAGLLVAACLLCFGRCGFLLVFCFCFFCFCLLRGVLVVAMCFVSP